jgi:inhibitor of KinA
MVPLPAYSIYPLGNNALIIDFGNEINRELNKEVLHLFRTLKELSIPYVTDIVPAYSSLAVYYDVVALLVKVTNTTVFEHVAGILEGIIEEQIQSPVSKGRIIKVPVCYSLKYALDIEEIAEQKCCSVEEIIGLHTAITYTVFMIGFLPGFAYMGIIDEKLQMPRKQTPRANVEGGSVGIAGRQTGIYPMTSPGGWQIIGKTPLQLFNKMETTPTLFQPGDEVQFYSITEHEFEHYQGRNI